MKYKLLLLLLVLHSFIFAQDKIGNKIYKYGDLYHSIQGTTVISFEQAKAKAMSKTIEYFSKAGANVKSLKSLYLPGTEISEDNFVNMLNENNIETLILIDIIDSSSATMNKTTSSAFSSVNASAKASVKASENARVYQNKAKSTSSAGSVNTSKTVDFITEMSLRLTIFSKKDAFSKPVAVVEGRATNGSPDTTADQIARRIVRRMAKALEKQNAF
jgi:hypothetical protein